LHFDLHPVSLYCYADCTYNRHLCHAYAYSILSLYFSQSLKRVRYATSAYNWKAGSIVENLRGETFPRYQLPLHMSSQRLPKCDSYPTKEQSSKWQGTSFTYIKE
jgi:hypothetical protein